MLQNSTSGYIVSDIAKAIIENKEYLSEIDGRIGDGDHGVNMAKGFSMAAEMIQDNSSLQEAFGILSNVLMTKIGGSMGPLYGYMFQEMSEALDGVDMIDATTFHRILSAGLAGVKEIGSAEVGDKTLLDTLVPSIDIFKQALDNGEDFKTALDQMRQAAQQGRDNTIDMVAKIGRASRLGERSRGVLDAGATSCCIILDVLAQGARAQLQDMQAKSA